MTDPLATLDGLYREHFAFVWRALRRLGVPEREVPDAAQDVFLVVCRKLEEVTLSGKVTTWLYAIALRVASERRKKAAHRREVFGEEVDHPSPGADVVRLLEQREQRELLETALDALSMDQRAVFTLFELEGWDGDRIADLLEIPVATVHSRLRLARETVRRVIHRSRTQESFKLQGGGANL